MSKKAKGSVFFDAEERETIENVEAFMSSAAYTPPTAAEAAAINERWRALLAKDTGRKPVTLRLQERDIERLKAIANRKGMPYQTLVSSILHQFANGDLVER